MKKRMLSIVAGLLCVCCLSSVIGPQTVKRKDAQLTVAQAAVTKPGMVTGLKAAPAGKNRVKLTWSAVSGAQGYLIYAQKNKAYAYCGMTSSGSNTTFTDTKALDGDYNYYWVFAYLKDSTGKMIAGGCQKYVYAKGICPAVTGLKATSSTSGVKLTWTKVSTADGYLIYGKTETGTYGYKGLTTNNTWTDTKAPTDVYSFYWVFPYHENAGGNLIVGATGSYVYAKKSLPEFAARKVGSLTYYYATEWRFLLGKNNSDEYYWCAYQDTRGAIEVTISCEKMVEPSKAASFDIVKYAQNFVDNYRGVSEYKNFQFISQSNGQTGDLKWYDAKYQFLDDTSEWYCDDLTVVHLRTYIDLKTGFVYVFQGVVWELGGTAPVEKINRQMDVFFGSIKKV